MDGQKELTNALVFPAYAGVIPEDVAVRINTLSVPRVCGGDPYPRKLFEGRTACSPRMRG